MNQDTNKISIRHNTRALALSVMYSLDINNNLYLEEDKNVALENVLSDVLAMSQTEFFTDEFPTLYNQEFLRTLTSKCYLEIASVDEIISKSLVKYTIDRLSFVDRAIIRIATAEMLIGETPRNIIIDEALELTKELTNIENDQQVKFNNRLLDNIAREIYGK